MKQFTASIIIDRHGDIRAGWRILIFMVLVLVLTTALAAPMSLLEGRVAMLGNIFLVSAALGATYVMTRFLNHKPLTSVGLALHPTTFKELGAGCLLGFLMMAGIFLIGVGLGYATPGPYVLAIGDALWVGAGALVWFGTGALAEELLFRGYAFQTLIQGVTFLPATILMAAVFALVHTQNPNITAFSLVNTALAGVMLSIAYMKTRSLWLPLGLHFAWNFSQTTIFGFPTSGISPEGRALITTAQTGPDWVLGGTAGPEGGILATVAVVICTWYILKAPYLRAPEGIVTLDSVEDLIGPTNGRGEHAQ